MTTQASKSYMLALGNPMPGLEDEFNEWYTNVHIKEAITVDGFVSAQRFKLSDTQMRDSQPYKYLAIYEIESGREAEAIANLKKAIPTFDMKPVVDVQNSHMMVVQSISDLLTR